MSGQEISMDELWKRFNELSEKGERLFAKLDQRAKEHEVWKEDMKKIRAEINATRERILKEAE